MSGSDPCQPPESGGESRGAPRSSRNTPWPVDARSWHLGEGERWKEKKDAPGDPWLPISAQRAALVPSIPVCPPPQTSACTVASVVSDKFSRLLQALEERRVSALRDLEEARSRASAQAQEVEQRLQRHLQALAEYDSRARAVLDREDDVAFLQVGLSVPQGGAVALPFCPAHCGCPWAQESQLLMLPTPVDPPSPLQWDEEQQVGGLKKWLSQLAGLLLEEGTPKAPAEAAGLHPLGKVPQISVLSCAVPVPLGL